MATKRTKGIAMALALILCICVLPITGLAETLSCGMEEHVHAETCFKVELPCTIEEHAHTEECKDAEGSVICGKEEHSHEGETPVKVVLCGCEEHVHTEDCMESEDVPVVEQNEVAALANEETSISKSKTATELVDDESVVTLKVGGVAEEIGADIVFILGQRPSTDISYITDIVKKMAQSGSENASPVKFGIVTFADNTEKEIVLPLTEMLEVDPENLDPADMDKIIADALANAKQDGSICRLSQIRQRPTAGNIRTRTPLPHRHEPPYRAPMRQGLELRD